MPAARPIHPRKAPVQERSRATVERILDAGTRVLVEHGYEKASTNRIATAAGVSPGSLYQYFPNKDAILTAVAERYGRDLTARIADHMATLLDATPETVARSMLDALVTALAEEPEILRAVVELMPNSAAGDLITAFEQRIADLLRGYLIMHRRRLRDLDLDSAIWILVQLVEQLSVRYVLDRPPIPREQFVEELTQLAIRYLARPEALVAWAGQESSRLG